LWVVGPFWRMGLGLEGESEKRKKSETVKNGC
jgi:hypothetical protein